MLGLSLEHAALDLALWFLGYWMQNFLARLSISQIAGRGKHPTVEIRGERIRGRGHGLHRRPTSRFLVGLEKQLILQGQHAAHALATSELLSI